MTKDQEAQVKVFAASIVNDSRFNLLKVAVAEASLIWPPEPTTNVVLKTFKSIEIFAEDIMNPPALDTYVPKPNESNDPDLQNR